MIMMMFVVVVVVVDTEAALVTTSGYCFFGCAMCVYFRLWVCNTVIGTVAVEG